MSKLALIDYILNPDFKVNDNFLEEPSVSMKVDLIQDRCQSIVFEFDKQLGREYKGGLFPFFNSTKAKVCKVCDYIIFSEYDGNLYALIMIMKTWYDTIILYIPEYRLCQL